MRVYQKNVTLMLHFLKSLALHLSFVYNKYRNNKEEEIR